MKILHVVPGLKFAGNGIAVAAKLIAEGQRKEGHDAQMVEAREFGTVSCANCDEVWVHSMWLPVTMRACWKVLRARVRLVRMTHGCLDPMRYRYHGWKKRLVAPIERWLMRRADRVAVTGVWESEWVREWLGLRDSSGDSTDSRWTSSFGRPLGRPAVEVVDMKRFFRLEGVRKEVAGTLNVLYLGRRHPLKGVEYLERAVEKVENVELRIVSDHRGEELERDWEWCDVLCLPTLSENFGLVVAEALERGKRVITTDGAPAWEGETGVVYLRGYREGNEATRVRLLVDALKQFLG